MVAGRQGLTRHPSLHRVTPGPRCAIQAEDSNELFFQTISANDSRRHIQLLPLWHKQNMYHFDGDAAMCESPGLGTTSDTLNLVSSEFIV